MIDMPYRTKDSDEIDDFFDEELCDHPEILKEIEDGKFNIEKLPSFDFLFKIVTEIPSVFGFMGLHDIKSNYRDSVNFLDQPAIPKRGDVCLVRQLRVYDEKYFFEGLKNGKPVGVYWSVYEMEGDFPVEEESIDDVYVIISACFDVKCIDVVKSMLAHLAWGAWCESEIRLFPGCKGILNDFNVYNLDRKLQKSFDVKGMKVTT